MKLAGKQRVLLCHNYYRDAGGESIVFETELSGLASEGHSICKYLQTNTNVDSSNIFHRIAIVINGFFSFRSYRDIIKIIKNHKPEVAIVQNFLPLLSPSVYYALASQNIPVIQAVYNYRFVCPNAHLYTNRSICEKCIRGNYLHCVKNRCYRNSYLMSAWYASILWIHRRLYTFSSKIDLFMVPDQFLKGKLIEGGIPGYKICINPNPYHLANNISSVLPKKKVLYLGRLIPPKGILTLVKALQLVESDVQLIIAGQGELEAKILKMIKDNHLEERVSFVGPKWDEDAKAMILESLALVVPSEWYDNLPVVICQANELGRPVIASRIDGIPEYITEGLNGFLFEPGDPEALARQIDKLAHLDEVEYQSISKSSRKVAEKIFAYSNHYRILKSEMDRLSREKTQKC